MPHPGPGDFTTEVAPTNGETYAHDMASAQGPFVAHTLFADKNDNEARLV